MKIFAAFAFVIVAAGTFFAQTETLNNEKIVLMTRAGLSESIIVRKIETEMADFDLSTESLVALKKSGVADSVLEAMFLASSNASQRQTPPPTEAEQAETKAVDNNIDVSFTQNSGSRIVLDKGEALLNAKTIAIEKSSLHPSRQAIEKELMKRPDWQALNLNIVRLKDDADLYIEIGYVSLSWITHRYVYRVYDRRSGTVITAGETTSWGSLAENLARGISKRLTLEYTEAKKTK